MTRAEYNTLTGKVKTSAMNKTEEAYGLILEAMARRGKIKRYKFEALKLRLAGRTHFTPDFYVVTDKPELHEVKGGFIREDAWIKLKVAAEMYPEFRFILAQHKDKQWTIKEVGK